VLLMGGKNSDDYHHFVELFCSGMNAIRKRCDELCLILQIMMDESDLECFQHFRIE
jgi:phosphatidylinositol 4-kinase